VLGAVLYVVLKEYLAVRWVDIHLLIFGALFIAIVLVLPGGLVQAVSRVRKLYAQIAAGSNRRPGNGGKSSSVSPENRSGSS
jgi:hypothetical protein